MVEQESSSTQQQEAQKKGCTGNCMACLNEQRLYCASQIGYNTMVLIGSLQERINKLQETQTLLQGIITQLVDSIASQTNPAGKAQELFAAPEPQDAIQSSILEHNTIHEVLEESKKKPARKKQVTK